MIYSNPWLVLAAIGKKIEFSDRLIPVIDNVTAKPLRTAASIGPALIG